MQRTAFFKKKSLEELLNKNQAVSAGSHLLRHAIFRTSGYQREIRRTGDLQLGYWRKTLKERDQRTPYPKRFVLIPGFRDTSWTGYLITRVLSPLFRRKYDE